MGEAIGKAEAELTAARVAPLKDDLSPECWRALGDALLTPSLGRAGRRLVVDKFAEAARQMRYLKQHNEAMQRAIDHPERWVADGGRA